MTGIIFNPFSGIPANKKSHVRGWALHWADCLDAEIADKDTDLSQATVLYLDHGVNFGGSLNLFGGVTDEVCDRLEQIIDGCAALFSLDIPMPNYVEQLSKRAGQATCSPRLQPMLKALERRFASAQCIPQESLAFKRVTIGDSHSTAFAPEASAVLRHNGQTLYGALRDRLVQGLMPKVENFSELTLVFGSIDLRHHIGRRPNPQAAITGLVERYAEMVREIEGNFDRVEVCYAVPVEHEGRKIPQTGFYGGTPFAGSRDDRRLWTALFSLALDDAFGMDRVISPPNDWYSMDGEAYASKIMELSSSVHIAPIHYRRHKWGVA